MAGTLLFFIKIRYIGISIKESLKLSCNLRFLFRHFSRSKLLHFSLIQLVFCLKFFGLCFVRFNGLS